MATEGIKIVLKTFSYFSNSISSYFEGISRYFKWLSSYSKEHSKSFEGVNKSLEDAADKLFLKKSFNGNKSNNWWNENH